MSAGEDVRLAARRLKDADTDQAAAEQALRETVRDLLEGLSERGLYLILEEATAMFREARKP